jgi:hypothetical protein
MESSRESLLFIVTIVTTVAIKQMIPSREDYILHPPGCEKEDAEVC